jgi:hypothetical protein
MPGRGGERKSAFRRCGEIGSSSREVYVRVDERSARTKWKSFENLGSFKEGSSAGLPEVRSGKRPALSWVLKG